MHVGAFSLQAAHAEGVPPENGYWVHQLPVNEPNNFSKEEQKMTKNEAKNGLFGDVTHQYTRAQAIENRDLIDVTHRGMKGRNPFPNSLDGHRLGSLCSGPRKPAAKTR